jgi:hypothetical protein
MLAMTIMALSFVVLAEQMKSAVEMSRRSVLGAQALALAEAKFAELENISVRPSDEPIEGDFGPAYPNFQWEVLGDRTYVDRLYLVVVRIRYDDGVIHLTRQLGGLRAAPARFSLERDFGLPPEEVAIVEESFPVAGFDLNDFSLDDLANLDLATIVAMLPQLLALLGDGQLDQAFGPEMLEGLTSAAGGLGIPNLDTLLEQFGGITGGVGSFRGDQPDPFGDLDQETRDQIENMINGGQSDPENTTDEDDEIR